MPEDNKWYSPSSIAGHYTIGQVKWLLRHWLDLVTTWLPECKETGYTGDIKQGTGQAPFIRCAEVKAELGARLTACGKDGNMTLAFYSWGSTPEYICQQFHVDKDGFYERRDSVLRYCSGKRRRTISYEEFCKIKEETTC